MECPNFWQGQQLFTFKYHKGCVTLVPKLYAAHCMKERGVHYPICIEKYCDDNFPFGYLLYLDNLHEIAHANNLIRNQEWLHGGALLTISSSEYRRKFSDDNTYRCINFTHWCSPRSEYGCDKKTSKYYCTQVNDDSRAIYKGMTLFNLKINIQTQLREWHGPMCRNVCIRDSGTAEFCNFYECRKGLHEWIPCMHEARYPCERVRKKGCNYHKAFRYCVTHYYTEVPAERRKYQRCDEDYGEKCNCSCTRKFSEWSQWSATCGNVKRIRIAPYDQPRGAAAIDCSFQNQIECCVETATLALSPCTDYIYGTNISLVKTSCAVKGGTRGRDPKGHYMCVCRRGYHGLLCEQRKRSAFLRIRISANTINTTNL
ncbi:hypothetical protein D918_07679 [Trichuris suis]|nr:hypothetical protein D918_07679 [Trichuris suis]